MSTLRKKLRVGFTHMSNDIFNEEGMSFRARGLLCTLLSKPDDWTISIDYLAKIGKEGKQAIRSALQELAVAGYLMRQRVQGKDGKIGTITAIADYPAFVNEGTPDSRIYGYEPAETDLPETDPSETDMSETESSENRNSESRAVGKGDVLVKTVLPITDLPITKQKAKPAAAALDPDVAMVWESWNANMPGTKSKVITDGVNELLTEYSAAEIVEAIAIACRRHKRSLSYIQGILEKGVFGKPPITPGGDYRPSTNGRMSPVEKGEVAANELRAMIEAHGKEKVLHG